MGESPTPGTVCERDLPGERRPILNVNSTVISHVLAATAGAILAPMPFMYFHVLDATPAVSQSKAFLHLFYSSIWS